MSWCRISAINRLRELLATPHPFELVSRFFFCFQCSTDDQPWKAHRDVPERICNVLELRVLHDKGVFWCVCAYFYNAIFFNSLILLPGCRLCLFLGGFQGPHGTHVQSRGSSSGPLQRNNGRGFFNRLILFKLLLFLTLLLADIVSILCSFCCLTCLPTIRSDENIKTWPLEGYCTEPNIYR